MRFDVFLNSLGNIFWDFFRGMAEKISDFEIQSKFSNLGNPNIQVET
jgi:hypothetical protein